MYYDTTTDVPSLRRSPPKIFDRFHSWISMWYSLNGSLRIELKNLVTIPEIVRLDVIVTKAWPGIDLGEAKISVLTWVLV